MLGLLAATDARWATVALADLDEVLRDHAHCEMKAAVHAMSLAARHPDDLGLVRKLVALAQEELAHFDRVVVLLASRGVALGPPPIDAYAASLRAEAAKLPHLPIAQAKLVDRLLVAALIEARSCERFKLLASEMGEKHPLQGFYTELLAAEARHYRELIELAMEASGEQVVTARLGLLAALEANIVRAMASAPESTRATIHG
jgi:tRNA 2-(methylsulfanyl)-N6-isopentenyladenosine37 hydroxylase